jgi:hypothetical protein
MFLQSKFKEQFKEWLALNLSVSSGVGVQFAQSSSQWEARADI